MELSTQETLISQADFLPIYLFEMELSQPFPASVVPKGPQGKTYRRALVLVRLHDQPVGQVELSIGRMGLSAEDLSHQIWQALGNRINEHLKQDGFAPVSALPQQGLPQVVSPACHSERDRLLANAPMASIVIATRNRTDSLAKCIQSLLGLDYPNYEIIIVDNNPSSSATADFIHQTYGNGSPVRYVRENRPGLAAAHNCGLQAARGEFIAFTDDDVAVDRYWLAELIKDFYVSENVGCVTGLILPAELETPAQVWIEEFSGFGKGYARKIYDLNRNRPDFPLFPYTAGRFGSGANMAFRVSVLRGLNGFDPATGTGTPALGGDDLSMFFQVITYGYQIVYEPAAMLRHWHYRDYASLRRQVYGYGAGLSAYLTKVVIDQPGLLPDIAAKVIPGLRYAFSPSSHKNQRKPSDYPKELNSLERKGMLYGPIAYLRSRWQSRRYPRSLYNSYPTKTAVQ